MFFLHSILIFFIFILCIFSLPFKSFALADSAASLLPSIRFIQEKGVLVVGIPPFQTKPFYYIDKSNEKLSGYDIDIATQLADRLGVNVVFDNKSSSFDDLVRRSGNGDVDIAIGKLGTTYSRLYNSNPHIYLKFNQALLINRQVLSGIGLDSDKSLGKYLRNSSIRVGAIGNSAYTTYATYNFSNARISAFKDWNSTVDALMTNKVDAIYRDIIEIKTLIANNPRLNIDYAIINIMDGLDQKSIYIGNSLQDLGPFVDHLIADEFGILTSNEIMAKYSDLAEQKVKK